MLSTLSIRNIVLIDSLDLNFQTGLTALTGETGAGKSILLDAFALALGARGDASLVRQGVSQGQVVAVFDLPDDHPVYAVLLDCGISCDGTLILRRIQSADGRSKSFVNDEPVTVQLLRRVGALVVEIHGQHDDRALVETNLHRDLLDSFGGLDKSAAAVAEAWKAWQSASRSVEEFKALVKKASEDAGYLAHAIEELQTLAPKPGEEESLAARRQVMMHAEKISSDLDDAWQALAGDSSAEANLNAVLRKLERRLNDAADVLGPAVQAIERVLIETSEAKSAVQTALKATEYEPFELENTEDRLFALRAAARKYKVQPDSLADLCEKFKSELSAIDDSEHKLDELRRAERKAAEAYKQAATALSAKRKAAASKLDKAVMAELKPLKLGQAEFITHMESVGAEDGGQSGVDRVAFWVRTNPGTESGPMMKIASGGELARFILALKVVLAARGSAPVLIFDEIDTGVGGAVATAIGQRLQRLAEGVQVLAITHSPQVAALSNGHLHISKELADSNDSEAMVTNVIALDGLHRREEIARMLAGTNVTDEARAAADRLIVGEQ